MILRPLSLLLALLCVPALGAADKPSGEKAPERKPVVMPGVRIEAPPFYFETDVGVSPAEQNRTAQRFLKPLIETSNFFLQVYSLKPSCFDDYAAFYKSKDSAFEKLVRVRLWKRYEDFLGDYQYRYESRSLPGAFFGIISLKDDYGKASGVWVREVGTSAEGEGDEQILRHFYHELGHLFMRTFMIYQVEVPSWIEEGTAELFQYRKGNGTRPEAQRLQRQGWLCEMAEEASTIPWAEFIKVQNLDNLDFTWKDPLRSTIQYCQAWSVMEFMIATSERQAAYTQLLRDLKAAGEAACREAGQKGLKGKAFLDAVRPALYSKQEALFKKNYGADLLAVEAIWKTWMSKEFAKDVLRTPILRYHRGEWHVGLRARFARTAEERKAEIAKAQAIFEECVKLTPAMPEGHVGLGRVAMESGRLDEAAKHFAKAIELGSDNYDALLYGGVAQIRSGRSAEAVAALTKAQAQQPSAFEPNFFLGQALAASGGDAETCVAALRRARDLNPAQVANCSLLEGAALYQAGKAQPAYIAWLRAANTDPGNARIAVFMALAKAANNDAEEAAALLQPHAKDALAARIAELIKAGKSLPKVAFDEQGWPVIDFGGAPAQRGKGKDLFAEPK